MTHPIPIGSRVRFTDAEMRERFAITYGAVVGYEKVCDFCIRHAKLWDTTEADAVARFAPIADVIAVVVRCEPNRHIGAAFDMIARPEDLVVLPPWPVGSN
jgi:hypothetical protein